MSGGDLPDDDEGARQRAIEESLSEALSDLERMLQRHRTGEAGARGAPDADAPAPTDDGEQYTIPLLDDVVVPGVPVSAPEPAPAPATGGFDAAEDDEPALRRRIAARLASEVEVIVQDRIEAALEGAREEIREQVRNHMDIILPEVVDELVQARRRRDG